MDILSQRKGYPYGLRRGFVSALDRLTELARRGVRMRMLHAGLLSRAFFRILSAATGTGIGRLEDATVCGVAHFKAIIMDGTASYMGSAKFSGEGMGAQREGARNFELAILTRDPCMLLTLAELFAISGWAFIAPDAR